MDGYINGRTCNIYRGPCISWTGAPELRPILLQYIAYNNMGRAVRVCTDHIACATSARAHKYNIIYIYIYIYIYGDYGVVRVFVCCALKTEAALIPTNAFCFTPPVLALSFKGFKPMFLPVFKTSLKRVAERVGETDIVFCPKLLYGPNFFFNRLVFMQITTSTSIFARISPF